MGRHGKNLKCDGLECTIFKNQVRDLSDKALNFCMGVAVCVMKETYGISPSDSIIELSQFYKHLPYGTTVEDLSTRCGVLNFKGDDIKVTKNEAKKKIGTQIDNFIVHNGFNVKSIAISTNLNYANVKDVCRGVASKEKADKVIAHLGIHINEDLYNIAFGVGNKQEVEAVAEAMQPVESVENVQPAPETTTENVQIAAESVESEQNIVEENVFDTEQPMYADEPKPVDSYCMLKLEIATLNTNIETLSNQIGDIEAELAKLKVLELQLAEKKAKAFEQQKQLEIRLKCIELLEGK